MSAKAITFPIPKGYAPPDGTQPGQTFDESVTFKLSSDGKSMTVWALNGIPAPGNDDDENGGARAEDDGSAMPPSSLASNYQAAMGGGGAAQS